MHAVFVLLLLTQTPRETNPAKIVFSTTIQLYQKWISPSQGDVCNFSPSCSQFTKEAIDTYGLLWGTLMGADRFMRCNVWSAEHLYTYYHGIRNNKIYDPVENNYIFKKRTIKDSTEERR